MQVARDGHIRVEPGENIEGKRVRYPAVSQEPSMHHRRLEDPGHGDARHNRIDQGAARQGNRLSGEEIGGHRHKGDREVFDQGISEKGMEEFPCLFPCKEAGYREYRIGIEAQGIQERNIRDKLFEGIQSAARIHGPHSRTCAGAHDDIDRNVVFSKNLETPMCAPPIAPPLSSAMPTVILFLMSLPLSDNAHEINT